MTEYEARRRFICPHFQQRFRERVDSQADPVIVGQALIWAIANHRRDLYEFVGRDWRPGRRRFRARTYDGAVFEAIVDTDDMSPITVLTVQPET